MSFEDFLTFTEVDSGDDITVTDTTITATTMQTVAVSYVKKDYGANHFGDFEHLHTMTLSAIDDGTLALFWMLASNAGTNTYQDALDNDESTALYFFRTGDLYYIRFRNMATDEVDGYSAEAPPNDYYLTTKRAGTAGTCKIYSDAEKTDLLDTINITVPATKYQYLIALGSRASAGVELITLVSSYLDLQEPAVEVGGMILRRPRVQVNPLSNI